MAGSREVPPVALGSQGGGATLEEPYDFSGPIAISASVARAGVAVPISAEPVRVGRIFKKSRDPYVALANGVVSQGLVEPSRAAAAAKFFRALGTAPRPGHPLLRAYLRSHSGVTMFGNFLAELVPPIQGLEVGSDLSGLVDFARQVGVGPQPGADVSVVTHRLGEGVRSSGAPPAGEERFSSRIEYFVPLPRKSDGRPVLLTVHADARGGEPVSELVNDIDQMAAGVEVRTGEGPSQ